MSPKWIATTSAGIIMSDTDQRLSQDNCTLLLSTGYGTFVLDGLCLINKTVCMYSFTNSFSTEPLYIVCINFYCVMTMLWNLWYHDIYLAVSSGMWQLCRCDWYEYAWLKHVIHSSDPCCTRPTTLKLIKNTGIYLIHTCFVAHCIRPKLQRSRCSTE